MERRTADPLRFGMTKKARRVPWYPTQAKTGLEWGTQQLLPGRDLRFISSLAEHQAMVSSSICRSKGGACIQSIWAIFVSAAFKAELRQGSTVTTNGRRSFG
jgi:hypothetical protein